jgi:predicted GTPase
MKKNKLNVFISYAHEDEAMKNDLDKHLIMLKRSDKIEVWTDKAVLAGDEWDVNIQEAMQKADIILLLVSVDFNNSNIFGKRN